MLIGRFRDGVLVDSLGYIDNRGFLDDSVNMWSTMNFDMALDLPGINKPLERSAMDLVPASEVCLFGPRVSKAHIGGCYSLQLPPKRAGTIARHTSKQ